MIQVGMVNQFLTVSHLLRTSREGGRSFSSGQQLEATSDR